MGDDLEHGARVRVLVLETPAAIMRPFVEQLCETDLDVVTTDCTTVAGVIDRFTETHAHVMLGVVTHLSSVALQVARTPDAPIVLIVEEFDQAGRTAARLSSASAVVPFAERGRGLSRTDWSKLLQAVEGRGRQTMLLRRASRTPSGGHPAAPNPDFHLLEREVAFRYRNPGWDGSLARPVHVVSNPTIHRAPTRSVEEILSDESSDDSFRSRYAVAFDGVPPEEMPSFALRELLAATGEPGGATEDFAIRVLRMQVGDEDLRGRVEAILRTGAELSGTLKGHCAKALYRLGEVDRADALLAGITDPDARVLAADIAKERGRDAEALEHVEHAAGARLETLGAVERVARWRDAIHRKPTRRALEVVPLTYRGAKWTVVFEAEPALGRTGVAIVVPAPAVSRRHLVFRKRGAQPELEDQRSHHGVLLDGRRVTSAVAIDRPLTLQLAGSIACDVRPGTADEGGLGAVCVDVAGERWLLTFGAPAQLGPYRVSREDGRLVVRSDRGFFLVGDDDPHQARTVCDLAPEVALLETHAGPTDLVIGAEAFALD